MRKARKRHHHNLILKITNSQTFAEVGPKAGARSSSALGPGETFRGLADLLSLSAIIASMRSDKAFTLVARDFKPRQGMLLTFNNLRIRAAEQEQTLAHRES